MTAKERALTVTEARAVLGSANGPVVYVSGPMRGLPDFNYPEFNEAAVRLRAKGYTVVNPAEHFDGSTDLDPEVYLREDIRRMAEECDAIFLLPGWQNSGGARVEYAVAKALGFRVINPDLDEDGTVIDEPVEYESSRLVRNGARQRVYGHPAKDFNRTAGMWAAYLGAEVTARDVALMMAMLKASRLKASPAHHDSIVDLIGYGICYDRLGEDAS